MNLTVALLLFASALSGENRVLWEQNVAGRMDAIDVTEDSVLVAGSSGGRFLVAAYDARSGDPRWSDLREGRGENDKALVIAHRDGRTFAAGYSFSIQEQSSDSLVRAYEESGRLLWEAEVSNGGINLANRIEASRDHVFVGGVSAIEQSGLNFVLRVYNAETGDLQWEKTLGRAPVGFRTRHSPPPTEPLPLCLAGDAIVEGGSRGTSDRGDVVARAYEADTGRLVWQAERQPSEGGSRTIQLVSDGSRVYALGHGFKSGKPQFLLLTAMRASDGRVIWEKSLENEEGWLSPSLLAVASDEVFVTAPLCPSSACSTVILAHQSATGALLWQRQLGGEAGWGRVSGMSAAGSQILMVGSEPTEQGADSGFVRGHDQRTGRLRWEDPSITPHLVAARAGLAFVGGFVDLNQVLRAYRISMSPR
jgi:outer membrane protein assembly factor BamB